VFDSADYELAWPRKLFVAEAKALLNSPPASWVNRFELLLMEAFRGGAPADDFRGATADEWGSHTITKHQFADRLAAEADTLRQANTPRPYWPARHSESGSGAVKVDPIHRQRDFTVLITELKRIGYFDQTFPTPCVDDREPAVVDPNSELAARLGVPGLWPLRPGTWDDETFYGLIEVFHDLVARPRERTWHDYGGCGWHYAAFALEPARWLYRWRVNRLLEAAGVELRLADSGEDTGRLVHLVDPGRADLLESALSNPDRVTRGTVEHAIALFRARSATDHNKKSAIVALAGILEERRKLLKASVFTKDEGALFRIANEFGLRHQNEAQKFHYDSAFLDWVFWWYLGTVELTDRLIVRQATTP